MRNCQVAEAWATGQHGRSNRMWTNGRTLWSYNLPIGDTLRLGAGHYIKVAYDYIAPRNFVSQTTSYHVGLAKQVADRVEAPSNA